MTTSRSKTHFSRLTKSTILFFVSFAFMAFVDKTKYEYVHAASVVTVIASHLASVFFISSFISSVGKNGIAYALGALVIPFWGDAIVYYICRSIAIKNRLS